MTSVSLADTALPSIITDTSPLTTRKHESHTANSLVVRRVRSVKADKRGGGKRDKQDRKPKPLNDSQRKQLSELARDIAEGHSEFEQWLMATAGRAIQIGELGFKAKRIAGHGHFGEWKENLRNQYGIAERSLERYMYLYKNRRKLAPLISDSVAVADGAVVDASTASLQSVRIQEALDFLEQSAKPAAKKMAPRAKAIALAPHRYLPTSVLQIARELFRNLDFVVCDQTWAFPAEHVPHVLRIIRPDDADFSLPEPWRGHGLIHSDQQQLNSVLPLANQMFEKGPLESALLLVPVVTDDPALEMFYSFPRAFFRQRLSFAADGGGELAASQPYMLIFLGPADRIADFHYAAGGETDVYVPYGA